MIKQIFTYYNGLNFLNDNENKNKNKIHLALAWLLYEHVLNDEEGSIRH
jgi:hypothetical protein